MSNYDLFFQALNEMQSHHQLSADEKKTLKSKMVAEDTQVMQIVKLTSIKTMKDQIIEFLKKESAINTPKKSESPTSKYKNSNDSISIRDEFRAKTNSSDSINTDEQTLDSITDRLEKILLSIQQDKKSFSIFEKKNLQKIRKQVESLIEQKINNLQQKNDIVQIIKRIQPKIQQQYNFFKHQIFLTFRQILQLSVQEMKLTPLIQIMQKILQLTIGYAHFSYIYEKDDNTLIFFDSQKETNLEIQNENNKINNYINIKQFIESLKQNKYSVFDREQYGSIKDLDLFSHFNQTKFIKIFHENHQKNIVFFIHKLENDIKSLSSENPLLDSQIQDNQIGELGLLYYQTLQAHKMNLFTPFIFTSQYLDVFTMLLDSSILYFLWELINQLKNNLNYEIEIDEIQKYQNEDQNSLTFNFLKKTYIINQNGITLEVEFPNNLELINIFNRYKKYVQRIKNKTKIYKKFIKNSTKLMLDFDKNNSLIFISQPLSIEMRQKFHIPPEMDIFDENQRFDTIFAKNPKLLEDIKDTKSKINKLSFQNNFIQSYHIPEIDFYFEYKNHKIRNFNLVINDLDIFYERLSMSQTIDKSVSGSPSQNQNSSQIQDSFMTLSQIDEENDELTEIQKQKIQRRISKVINYSQTAKLLKNLQNEDPSFKDSQIQLFLPEDLSVKKQDNQITKQVKFQIQDDKKNKISYNFDTGIFERKPQDSNFLSLDWNALECDTIQEMQRTAWAILDQGGWIEKMQIEQQTLLDFLQMMEGKYNQRKNTFHNYQHGIAVMQGCYGLSKGTTISKYLNDFEIFALTFSGLCHDVNHTGRTNIFEVNSLSKLALRYQDQSVLENHHLANTFKCLSHHNVFKNIPEQQFLELRKIMISNILYTDIKKHFSLIKDFENSFKLVTEDKKQIENTILPLPERIYGKTPEEVRLLTGMVIHTADFIGGAKQFHISRVWSERVNVEFAAQYEEEFKLGIPQTPYFKDLDKIQVVAKGEIGFYKFIVLPLWSLLNDFLHGEIQKNVNYLHEAISEWQKIMEQNQEQEIKKEEKK